MSDSTKAQAVANGQVPATIAARTVADRPENAVTQRAVALAALTLGGVALGRLALRALANSWLAADRSAIRPREVGRTRGRQARVQELRIAYFIIGELRVDRVQRRLLE